MFQLLRDGTARTRAELVALTGQSRSTVAARLDALVDLGLLRPAGEASSTGGRPPATFAFNPAARVVLAVDLGARHARWAVTDLAGAILAEHEEALDIAEGPQPVLGRVAEVGRRLLEEAGDVELASLGIGLPGPVDHERGRPVNPPLMPGWDGVDVPGVLRPFFGAPVLVDNDVNIMALGEHANTYSDVNHLLFIKVATGIGSGVISDGAIRRGAQGAAGDLGHVAVPGGPDVACHCGNSGCLEAVASGRAVAAELQASGLATHNGADVVSLVRAGNEQARHAVGQAGRRIGAVLAACVSMLNPSIIVIGGVVAGAGEHLMESIREVVYRRSLPLATQQLRIVASATAGRAGILGASAMAAEDVLRTTAVEAAINGRATP